MGKHYGQLDVDERIELSRHHDAGKAPSEIARIMGRLTIPGTYEPKAAVV
jgi:IS30 family transposase